MLHGTCHEAALLTQKVEHLTARMILTKLSSPDPKRLSLAAHPGFATAFRQRKEALSKALQSPLLSFSHSARVTQVSQCTFSPNGTGLGR